MKTNHEIVEENMKLIRTCVECQFSRSSDKEYMEDFYHDLIIILLEYDNDKMNDAVDNSRLNALITRIIQNNIFSRTSRFWRDYKKFNDKTREINEDDEQIADI